jgi:hypothetical protein
MFFENTNQCDLANHHWLKYVQRIKYKLHNRLGPVKIPNQKIKLPSVLRPRNHLVRLSLTNYKPVSSQFKVRVTKTHW